ncbi:hypothetical protein [Amycolatopsis thailandensis]|uniref:hypothetical protein n=1 Tax=Amycolatopsis thailandensis TaxID=589330 RepID=UPI001FCA1772|nr:hypothetical protein [Amycolatopsis thailandensis]
MVNQPRGPDGRWIKYKYGAGALVTAGVVVAATNGIGGASLDSAAGQALKGKSSSKKSAQKGRHSEAWQRLGWRRLKKQAKRELKCGPRSFGEVQRFFLRHPCVDLDRMFVTVADGAGSTISVSVAWVKMPKASDLKRLIDKDGTGNVIRRRSRGRIPRTLNHHRRTEHR